MVGESSGNMEAGNLTGVPQANVGVESLPPTGLVPFGVDLLIKTVLDASLAMEANRNSGTYTQIGTGTWNEKEKKTDTEIDEERETD